MKIFIESGGVIVFLMLVTYKVRLFLYYIHIDKLLDGRNRGAKSGPHHDDILYKT